MCQQFVEDLFSQRPQTLNELSSFVQRLSFTNVTEQLEQCTLGCGDKNFRSPIRKWLQCEVLLQPFVEYLRHLIPARESFREPRRQRLRIGSP